MESSLHNYFITLARGVPGANEDRPGLDKALAASREGHIFIVSKLDGLARFLLDVRSIADQLKARE